MAILIVSALFVKNGVLSKEKGMVTKPYGGIFCVIRVCFPGESFSELIKASSFGDKTLPVFSTVIVAFIGKPATIFESIFNLGFNK